MSKRWNSLPRCRASCFASSVLPTPVGPGEQEAAGRVLGMAEPGARALDRPGHECAPPPPGRRRRAPATPRACAGAPSRTSDACFSGMRAMRATTRSTSRHVDAAASALGRVAGAARRRPRRSRRRRCRAAGSSRRWRCGQAHGRVSSAAVGVAHVVVLPRSATCRPCEDARPCPRSDGSSTAIFCRRRCSARSFSMCLNSSKVVEPMRRISPLGQDRLHQVREVHGAAGGGAGADHRVQLVDEQDRLRAAASSAAISALKRSSKSPRKRVPASSAPRVEGEDLGVLEQLRARRPASRRCARPSTSAVLPTPASPTKTGLFLRRRQSTSSARCSSATRPISGSSWPSRARSVRFTA